MLTKKKKKEKSKQRMREENGKAEFQPKFY
jgi:hypothetical protein